MGCGLEETRWKWFRLEVTLNRSCAENRFPTSALDLCMGLGDCCFTSALADSFPYPQEIGERPDLAERQIRIERGTVALA